MNKDIHLEYMFTDRSGAAVFDAYKEEDRLTLQEPLFQIRIRQDPLGRTINLVADLDIEPNQVAIEPDQIAGQMGGITGTEPEPKQQACFRNHDNITCKCPLCVK